MRQFQDQKNQAWQEHATRFSCKHEDKKLRKRIIKGGAVQFVYQCQRCGIVAGQAVTRAKVLELCDGQEPPPLHTKLQEEWDRQKKESAKAIENKFNESFWSDYSAYLQSPEWAERRLLVLKRAHGICEGCGMNVPTEVHHLSYDHVGQEFLFELVAVCIQCHGRLHPEESTEEPPNN